MPVFDQLCHAASKAQEKNLIPKPLAERICAISRDRLHYKHLGLELYNLISQLVPAGSKGADLQLAAIEETVRRIEEKHRRI
jgi:hypothetical protein